jgi:hypothetical protein
MAPWLHGTNTDQPMNFFLALHASDASPRSIISRPCQHGNARSLPQAHSLSCYSNSNLGQHESCTTVAVESRTAKSLQNNHGSGAECVPTARLLAAHEFAILQSTSQPHKHENESERSSMLKSCPGEQLTVEFPATHHASGSIGPPGPSVGPASLSGKDPF